MTKEYLVEKLQRDVQDIVDYNPTKLADLFHTLWMLIELLQKESSSEQPPA